jgi:ABC-2 type transport system ATP-binding protein
MDPAIKIKNLSVVLGGNFKALDKVSVELERGRITGFIGPSGAGKTTLIRTIVGRQRPHAGEVEVFGERAGSPNLRPRLSYMTQETSVYNDLTVEENLKYFATMFGVKRKEIPRLINDILETIDMMPQRNQLVSNLSGGQKQRTSLAVALIGLPPLMVLDEPTVGLDPLLREQIWGLFRRLAEKGTTIIISSHVMDEAERCDDLLLIRNGHILAHGSPKDLCEQTGTKNVEQSFLKLVGEEK